MYTVQTTISVTDCKWQKELNQLSMPWEQVFPPEVRVISPKTGDSRIYRTLAESDPRLDQDGWDGVQMIYRTQGPTNFADYLVLYYTR